jgi:hypothetical protein
MDQLTAQLVFTIAASLLGFIIWLLIMFAVIRAAVLSALRKHAEEQGTPLPVHRD